MPGMKKAFLRQRLITFLVLNEKERGRKEVLASRVISLGFGIYNVCYEAIAMWNFMFWLQVQEKNAI